MQRPITAFILTLLAGLWMLLAGGMAMVHGVMGPGSVATLRIWGPGMMHGMMYTMGPALWFPWFGPVAGLVLLLGAIALYTRPQQARGWGLAILIIATIDLFVGMGGFLAAILGIVGGALAMSWKPTPQA